jgi:hypothetical protein
MKKTGQQRETRRLALRKQVIRNLDASDLAVVVAGNTCHITKTGNCPTQ